jgi:hypothetical protein
MIEDIRVTVIVTEDDIRAELMDKDEDAPENACDYPDAFIKRVRDAFQEYLEADMYQWLEDNWKSWIRDGKLDELKMH